MDEQPCSRRQVLKTLSVGATAKSLVMLVSPRAAERVHKMVQQESKTEPPSAYSPKYFSDHHYKMLQSLCQAILPSDEECGGAIEAGAPEFIDLLTSENKEYQVKLDEGLAWLDSTCRDRYGSIFLECSIAGQKQMLDLIAFQERAKKEPGLTQGVEFFSFLRNLTAEGFFTSEIGIKYLGYIGNEYVPSFPGCPSVPEI